MPRASAQGPGQGKTGKKRKKKRRVCSATGRNREDQDTVEKQKKGGKEKPLVPNFLDHFL